MLSGMSEKKRSVHVAKISRTVKDKTYTSYLLRRSYREGDQVKHETIGNLSDLPLDVIDYIRRRLSGEGPMAFDDKFEIKRSLPHGHVAAVLGTLRKIGLDTVIGSKPSRERDLVIAMIVSRIIHPSSKLATLIGLSDETANSTLAEELQLGAIETKEFYASLDWLLARQTRIESKLARKHLIDGTLVLYDVSSSYYTGRKSGLAKHGYSRDGKKGLPQIVYGLLCNREGCPIAIEVFAGNTSDPTTFSQQVTKVRERFSLKRVVFVGDRGMITSQRIDEDLRDVEGMQWITALRSEKIRALVNAGTIQPSLFDDKDLAEITSDDFPGERLVVCRNPLLADERARKRNTLLTETEKLLQRVAEAVTRTRNPLRGAGTIGLRVGPILKKYKMAKHFVTTITENSFTYHRRTEQIENEAKLDGIYVIRTSVAATDLSSTDTVRAYKDLSHVERAFRCCKTIDLLIRPVFHWKDDRIKSHVFLCMLAYYLEWHMRRELKPVLFDDHNREAAEATRRSIVSPAPRSKDAKAKDSDRRTSDNLPVQSFQSLLKDLGTLCRNYAIARDAEFPIVTAPTPLQRRVFELLGLTIAN